jgi:lipopolysaccharide biosynthesis regulator YciM
MEPELLCPASARCLFASLEQKLPAFAGTYGAGEPGAFSKESLNALIGELGAASGGPPRWGCAICGHQDEAHGWRCNECGAWESARLISVLAP